MICDELNPNCLVKSCCSKKCLEVESYINDMFKRLKNKGVYPYYYGNMIKNNYCPVCHSKDFIYRAEMYPGMRCEIQCQYCYANIDLIKYDYADEYSINSIYKSAMLLFFKGKSIKTIHWIIEFLESIEIKKG